MPLSGSWQPYVDALYAVFEADFLTTKPAVPRRTWSTKRYPESLGKASTFWHIISEASEDSKDEAERIPDPRRCERIRWPRPLVDALGHSDLRCWRNQRGRSERICISTSDFSYVIVLEDRAKKGYIMLWTSYHVELGHRRRAFQREHAAFIKSGAPLL